MQWIELKETIRWLCENCYVEVTTRNFVRTFEERMVKGEQILLLLVSSQVAVHSHNTSETFVRTNALRVVFTVVVEK